MKLPEWMKDEFEKHECGYCKKPLMEKGVETHGIREEKTKSKKKIRYVHFYDYRCPKCKNRSIFSFPTTFKEYIQDMIELANLEMPPQLTDGTEPEVDNSYPDFPPRKSGITDEEFNEAKRILDESEDLKDFFGKIGIPMDTPSKEKPEDENK